MKTLTALILCWCIALLPAQAQGLLSLAGSPPAITGGAPITATLWQNFETATPSAANLQSTDSGSLAASATWAVTGTLATSAGAQYTAHSTINGTTDTGTLGLITDLNAGNYFVLDLNTYPTTQTMGVFFHVTAMDDGTTCFPHSLGAGGHSGNSIAAAKFSRAGAVYSILLSGATDSSAVTLAAGTTYYLTIKYIQNGTCLLRVYETSGWTLVGSEVSCTGRNNSPFYHQCGGASASSTGDLRLDNFIIDSTGTTYPLGP